MSARETGLFSPLSRARLIGEQHQFHQSTDVPPQWSNGDSNDFTPSPLSGYSDRSSDFVYARMTSPYFEYTTTRRTTQRVMDGITSPGESPVDTFTFVEDTVNDENEFYSEFTTDHHTSRRLSENAVYDEIIRITTQVIGRYSDENTFGSLYQRGQDTPRNYRYEDNPYTPDPIPRSNLTPLPIFSIRELTPTPTPRSGRESRNDGGGSNNILPIDYCWRIPDSGSEQLVLPNQQLTITEMSPSPRDKEEVRSIGVISPISEGKFASPRLPDESPQPSPRIVIEHKEIPMKKSRLGRVDNMNTIEEETEPCLVTSNLSLSSHESTVSSKEKFRTKNLIDKHTNCNLYEEMEIDCARKKSMEKATNYNFYEEEGKGRDSGKEMIDKVTNCNFYEERKKKAFKREDVSDLHNSNSDGTITRRKKKHKAMKYNRKQKDKVPEKQTLPPLKRVPTQLDSDSEKHAVNSRGTEADDLNLYVLPTSDKNEIIEDWLASMHKEKCLISRQESESLVSGESNRRSKRDNTTLPDIPRPSACRSREVQRCVGPRRCSSDNQSAGASNLVKLPPIKSTSSSTKPKPTLGDKSPFLPSPPTAQRGRPRPSRHAKAASKPEWRF